MLSFVVVLAVGSLMQVQGQGFAEMLGAGSQGNSMQGPQAAQGATLNLNAVPNSVGQSFGAGNAGNNMMGGYAPTNQGYTGRFRAGMAGGSSRPYCRQTEKRLLMDNCAMSFGLSHISSFPALRQAAPMCKSDVFRCNHVDTLVRCVNSQPSTAVSDNCWRMIRDVLTEFLGSYGIPCTYKDLYERCKNDSIADFLPLEKRTSRGVGMNTNPMSYLMPMVQRYVTPLVFMARMGLTSLGNTLSGMMSF